MNEPCQEMGRVWVVFIDLEDIATDSLSGGQLPFALQGDRPLQINGHVLFRGSQISSFTRTFTAIDRRFGGLIL